MLNLLKQPRKRQKDVPCEFTSNHYSLRVGLLPHSELLQNGFVRASRNIKIFYTSNTPKKSYVLVLYLKLVSSIFYQIFIFHQTIALQKL